MQFDQLKRREFITLLSGAVAWLPDWARRAAAQNLPLVLRFRDSNHIDASIDLVLRSAQLIL
jgi:hypothetical protein